MLVSSATLVRNFTEIGYAIAKAPAKVHEKLSKSLERGMAMARYEDTPSRQIDVIKGQLRPKFIDQVSAKPSNYISNFQIITLSLSGVRGLAY